MPGPASVVTLTRDRNAHLANVVAGLRRSAVKPAELVVAWMGGEDPAPALRDAPCAVRVVEVDGVELPLAAARNTAFREATGEVVVSVDVDCVPSPALVGELAAAAEEWDALAMGPIRYLPPGADTSSERDMLAAAKVHPEREVIFARGRRAYRGGGRQFWSTAFAVGAATFERIGGFDESYRGYGIEDTDFGLAADAAGVPVAWVPDAIAFHQHHAETPFDGDRLPGLVRNAHRFFSKWGEWPAPGWLERLADEGRVRWKRDEGVLEVV